MKKLFLIIGLIILFSWIYDAFPKKISDEYPVLVVFLDLIMLGLFADFYEKYQIKEERERKDEELRRNQEIAEKERKAREYKVQEERKRKEEELRRNQEIAEKERKAREYAEWRISNPNLGYLYVLNNKVVSGHIKIGFTARDAIEERIKEINRGTGVIGKWQLAKKWHVDDAHECEKLVHKKFKEIRTQKDREFFKIELQDGIKLIQAMMDKRGFYINGEYWKDGKCKTNESTPQNSLFLRQSLRESFQNQSIGNIIGNSERVNWQDAIPQNSLFLRQSLRESFQNQSIGNFFVQDGIATDTKTGLMWLRFSYGQRWENGNIIGDPEKINWHDAMKIPEEFNQKGGYGEFTDWRIPNIDELKTLIDKVKGEKGNYIDADIFPNTNIWFWSSSPDASYSGNAWVVHFSYGLSGGDVKGNSYNVRLVRG